MTITRLPRLITLHFSHIRLTDARTFMTSAPDAGASRRLVPARGLTKSIRNPSPRRVVRRQLHLHAVAGQDPDEMDPHLAGDVGQNLVSGRQFHPEHGVGEHFDDGPFDLNNVLLGHPLPRWRTIVYYTDASAGSLVSTSAPVSVTATVCSKCAEGRPS